MSPRSFSWPIASTLAILVLMLAVLEIATRVGFTRISRIESRTHAEYLGALATRRTDPARPTVLLLGNSLLLEALDYEALQRSTAPHLQPVRFAIEQTRYFDWYYGIRRLLASGARPHRIVLCLNLSQLSANNIRSEYTAYYLIQTSDLVRAGQDVKLDPTGISSLFLARYSMFYAGRNNLRNFILNTLDPAYLNALHGLDSPPSKQFTDREVLALAAPRLKALRELCAQYNVEFDFLLPPGFEDGADGLLAAGQATGTSVLVPVPQHRWKLDMYRDGFHLNHEGAKQFTGLLTTALLKINPLR